MSKFFEQGYALLIGVGRSVCPEWSLPVTVQDVEALKAVLTNPSHCGYLDDPRHVRLLRNEEATKGNILRAMDALAKTANKEPEATVVIYYSGHGWLKEGGRYFLIPHDATPRALASTALPAERFIESLRQIQSRRLLVLLDTCHAEGMATAKKILPKGFSVQAEPDDLALEFSRGSGRVVVTSCRGQESSWIFPNQSLSIFTHHLIEALKGAGSQPGEKLVRVSALMHYLGKAVPASANKLNQQQTPFFKFESEDFPVAQIRCGKGLREKEARKTPPRSRAARQVSKPPPQGSRTAAGRDVITGSGSIQTGSSTVTIFKK